MKRWMLIFLPLVLGSFVAQPSGVTLPLCPAAIHNAYKVTGPDGWQYPSWHPQVDLINNCVFDHEHGSDPMLFYPVRYRQPTNRFPEFGYTATAHGMTEGHNGFKVYVFDYAGYSWQILQHQGTSNAVLAACNRYHTLDILARSLTTGAVVADVRFMADYGRSTLNTGPTIQSPNCPENVPSIDPRGIRQFPSIANGNVGYEPWRAWVDAPFFHPGSFVVNTTNPVTACNDVTCTVNVTRQLTPTFSQRGTWRLITATHEFSLHATEAYSNTFEWHGLPQYLAPNLNITPGVGFECYPINPFAYAYSCDPLARTESDAAPFLYNLFVTGGN